MLIRKAKIEDARALAKVTVDTWKSTYKGIMPEDFLNNLCYEKGSNRYTELISKGDSIIFVAENKDRQVIGFATGGKERAAENSNKGEIYAIYILEKFQRLGAGRKLIAEIFKSLFEGGASSIIIWTLKDNPSRPFYEAIGGRLIDKKISETGGVMLEEVAYEFER